MNITLQQWLSRQPYTQTTDSDRYYTQLANRVFELVKESPLAARLTFKSAQNLCCDVVGYFADILSETGLWAIFQTHYRTLYGRTLPFLIPDENYYEGEVNREDMQVLLWYLFGAYRVTDEVVSPVDKELVTIANHIYELLAGEYETAPDSPLLRAFCSPEENDTDNPEVRYRFADWLFWNSYLLAPSNETLSRQLIHEVQAKAGSDKEKTAQLTKLRREALYSLPAGPLALFAHEWVSLLWQHTLPEEAEEKKELHPYYQLLTQATGGEPICYIGSYPELDKFLSEAMQWGETPGGHFSHLAEKEDFILYATPYKGMLIASNIAACVCDPRNPYYNQEVAKHDSIELLTVPGRCPIDLLIYLCTHRLLPDAAFVDGDNKWVAENWDFIARSLLQDYYRAV